MAVTRCRRGGFPCCADLRMQTCRRPYPGGIAAGIELLPEIGDRGLPRDIGGSAPTLKVSRPARRSRKLRPACSRGRLAALSIEGFGSFVSSTTAPIATGWSNSCRVGIAPTEDQHLCTAHIVTRPFRRSLALRPAYFRRWREYQSSLLKLAAPAFGKSSDGFAHPPREGPGVRVNIYRSSTAATCVHDGKSFSGGVASLAVPWGMKAGDDDRLRGGYHLVWPRDLVETAGSLLAAGARRGPAPPCLPRDNSGFRRAPHSEPSAPLFLPHHLRV